MARVYGSTGKKRWSRRATAADLTLIKKIEAEPIPSCVPQALIPWGDLYRKGYHQGITHVHHFYTRRNLIRSEEHTSELQSLMRISYAVFCLKKKKICITHQPTNIQQRQQ